MRIVQSLLALVLLSTLSYGQILPNNQTYNNGGEITDADLIRVNLYIEGMRGFWTGFARSFYFDRKKEVSSRCFSNNLASELFFVVNFMEGKESLMQIVKFVTTASRILNDNLNYCGYTEAIEKVEAFCQKSTTLCTP